MSSSKSKDRDRKAPAPPHPASHDEPQNVSTLLRRALYALLLVAGVTSLGNLDGYGPLPPTAMLDAWSVAFLVLTFVSGRNRNTLLLLGLTAYLVARGASAYSDGDPMRDFAQAFRWVLYLATFAVAVGRRWGESRRPLQVVTFLLIGMALGKSLVTYLLLGSNQRPGLLLENNFEIALFSGLFAVIYTTLRTTGRAVGLAMLLALMLLAGSRSGAIAFAVVLVYALWQVRASVATRFVASLYVAPAVVAVPLLVFFARDQAFVNLDRIRFADIFIDETRYWSWVQWLIGSDAISPLSDWGCTQLSFYEKLFSSAGDGTCYSVIFHAFVLRVVFDAGLVGLLLAFGVPWAMMRQSRVQTSLALTLMGIAFTNSLSVSGLNNPYVALPILLAIVTAGRSDDGTDAVDPGAAVRGDRVTKGRVVDLRARAEG